MTSDPNYLSMTTADVVLSADFLDNIGLQAGSERRALATELAGHSSAWQQDGRPGFVRFLGEVNRQADRVQTELCGVAEWLRLAAQEYTRTAQDG
ncbi:hypothetical protein, partial [Aquitalea sp. ASV15]|uniref:hypothetical protein n=1 Tax=Aquitalea sp. ASV15 TaxID=2795104 RepID=UPI0018ECD6D4